MKIITIAPITITTHDGKRAIIPEGAEITLTKSRKVRCTMQTVRPDGKRNPPALNTMSGGLGDIARFVNHIDF